MEFLLVVGGLIGFVILAIRFGHDSRDAFMSAEHIQAGLGLTWDGHPAGAARNWATMPRRALRHHAALALYRFADWVQPPTNDARRAA
jgi:hypothetical protein